jgi:hypothetical protein
LLFKKAASYTHYIIFTTLALHVLHNKKKKAVAATAAMKQNPLYNLFVNNYDLFEP